jgi:type II secretory ATPase GspE/PulE/Tfp pilus assembly ATPase PilB-like protein
VLAQRLIRKVCKNCKEEYTPQPIELQNLGLEPDVFGGKKITRVKGCAECGGMGYRGRMVVHELMIMEDNIRALIMEKADSTLIKKVAQENGMITLRQCGVQKVLAGETTPVELVAVTQD